MELYALLLYLFILGASLGSFLNVVGLRLPLGESLWGRSRCDSCRQQLAPLDLIPFVSFLWLGGKCRYCRHLIPTSHFFVELITGVLVAAFAYRTHFVFSNQTVIIQIILLAVVALTVSDLNYQVILDEFLVVIFLGALFLHADSLGNFLPAALLASGSFWLIHALSRGMAMGFADVKYVFLMGLVLPPSMLLLALYLAFLTGGVISVILILRRKKGLKSTIAFGPFLSVGFIIALWLIN